MYNRITIEGGRIYDPALHVWEERELHIENGKIVDILSATADLRIDARDCLVVPGLIDYHVHYYRGGSENSVNADASSFCNGITTALDSGTTGAGGFENFYRSIVMPSQTRILSALLVASGGQSNERYPENVDPRYFDEERILSLFEQYRDNLKALKIRLDERVVSASMAENALRRTVEIAAAAHTRVVVHVADCPLPLEEVASILRPGDVICHIYQPMGNTCLNSSGDV